MEDRPLSLKHVSMYWRVTLVAVVAILAAGIEVGLAADYRPLVGRWQRTDGGYVIDIRRVAADGTMDAGYYNPRSINVSKSQASVFKTQIRIDVELRDAGYPGSTYTLLYDADRDALLGFYYQAAQRQNFDVIFVRIQ